MNSNTQRRTTPVRRFIAAFEFTVAARKQYERELTGQPKTLNSLIERGKKDFAAGRGQTFTIEQLRNMTHEVA